MIDYTFCLSKFKSCYYSNNLINKIKLLNKKTTNKVNILEIKKAIYYTKKYHGNQQRKSGEPYYSHPLIVTEMLADYCFKTDILITAILHDTLEDTKLTKDMISKIFGVNIANNVEDLTRIKPYGKITAADTIKLLWSEKKHELLLVKYFDRLHNLQTINFKSPAKIKKTVEETLKQFISLSIYFEKSNIPNLINKDHMNMALLCLQQLPKSRSYNEYSTSLQKRKTPVKNIFFEWIELFLKTKLNTKKISKFIKTLNFP